jgi:hypothetical protein
MFIAGGLRLEVSVESANNNQTTLVEGFYLSARMSKEFPEPMLEKKISRASNSSVLKFDRQSSDVNIANRFQFDSTSEHKKPH